LNFFPAKIQHLTQNDNGYIKAANILIAVNVFLFAIFIFGLLLLPLIAIFQNGLGLGLALIIVPLIFIMHSLWVVGTLYSIYFGWKFQDYKKALILFFVSGGPFILARVLPSC